MPVNKKYPIESLMSAVKNYQLKTKLRATFEYVLIKGLNDSVVHAQEFARLAGQVKCNINLIEYNPHRHCRFSPSGKGTIKRFAEILADSGLETSIRFKRGRKIKAACGQLGADMQRDI